MISGYQLRDGTNGTTNLNTTGRETLPGWALTSQGRSSQITSGQYGPSVNTTYALGHYAEDYDYLGDLSYTQGSHFNSGSVFFDLNEYNTRYCITPDYPNGTWAYFTTLTSTGTSFFPYSVGRWYRGNPNSGGGSTTSSTMTSDGAINQFLGGANSAITLGTPSQSSGAVTLTWSSVEGGTYTVANSANDSAFTTESSGLSPAVPTAPTVGNSTATTTSSYSTSGLSGTQYAKVSRTALASYDSAGQTAATVSQNSTVSYTPDLVPTFTSGAATGITIADETAYTYTFTASGYPAPTFSLTSGSLPPGLILSSAGVLSGTPTTTGTYSGTITASNGVGTNAMENFTITITASITDTPALPPWGLALLTVLIFSAAARFLPRQLLQVSPQRR